VFSKLVGSEAELPGKQAAAQTPAQ
jgi:hypothetical protein